MKEKLFCNTPIGKCEAPEGIAKTIINESNEELLNNLYSDGVLLILSDLQKHKIED